MCNFTLSDCLNREEILIPSSDQQFLGLRAQVRERGRIGSLSLLAAKTADAATIRMNRVIQAVLVHSHEPLHLLPALLLPLYP